MHDSQDTTGAYRSAVSHPYFVQLFAGWADHSPLTVGFQTRTEAESFAAGRPEPLIDLIANGRGVVAARRLVAHPEQSGPWTPRDDFPPRSVAPASPFVRRALSAQLPGKVFGA